MARRKQANPARAEPSELYAHSNGTPEKRSRANGSAPESSIELRKREEPPVVNEAGVTELVACVGGIYGFFLSWGVLQERITTTTYGSVEAPERFSYAITLNTIQSAFAAVVGFVYLTWSSRGKRRPPIFPSRGILPPLALVAVTSSLASPFGYASLKHIDYITYILAKSCKLLPVMALHVSIFRRRYPLYKYAVVAAVTAGVAVFTLHHPSSAKKRGKSAVEGASASWGLLLLGINLLFDGLTNSTQDFIFESFRPFSGPQMMVAHNVMSTALTAAYLLASPYVGRTALGGWLGMDLSAGGQGELGQALQFVTRHPDVGWDVLAFGACGAIGQLFIFYTLSNFSSLLLVTVTVTRKMLTMVLSVIWFGHRIRGMQWLGVGLVFGGIGAEALIQRREKVAKERAKREGSKSKKAL